jgi:hypothetical protein
MANYSKKRTYNRTKRTKEKSKEIIEALESNKKVKPTKATSKVTVTSTKKTTLLDKVVNWFSSRL